MPLLRFSADVCKYSNLHRFKENKNDPHPLAASHIKKNWFNLKDTVYKNK